MLKSLYVLGRYRGGILVLTDRTETEVAVPDEMTDMVRIVYCDRIDMSTRFQIQDFLGLCDTPALYIDTDIIITQEVDPILRKMLTKSAIYVGREGDLWPQLVKVASTITDKRANYFGLDLFLNDLELRDHPLPGLNSGLFGYSARQIFEQPARQIRDMYTSDRWSSFASRYTDQPMFNYVLAKSELIDSDHIDSDLLSNALSFVSTADSAVNFPRPFIHFNYASGVENKLYQMSRYMSILEAS